MRPGRCWMQLSMLAVMLLCLNAAEDAESECVPVFEVKRDTIYKAAAGEELRIECKTVLCDDKPPNASWYKYKDNFIPISNISRFKTEWKRLSPTKGIFYLIFNNTVRNDSGQFQCRIGDQSSHVIEIFVSDELRNNSTTDNTDSEPMVWLYVYSASGMAALVVVVVVVSVLAMRGCKGKTKEEERSERQYLPIPMTEQPQPPPRGSPIAPPCRRSIQRKRQGEEEKERGRGRSAMRKDQETSIVYAALSHPLPPRGGARPRQPAEAPSEYAAIRVA